VDAAQVRRVLEEYPTRFSFDHTSASTITDALTRDGSSMVDQLQLKRIFVPLKESTKPSLLMVNIEDSIGSSTFFGLYYWESLEQALQPLISPCVRIVVQRRAASAEDLAASEDITSPSEVHCARPLRRILLVVSRPRKQDDINPLLAGKAILQTIQDYKKRNQHVDIALEIVRPGSWKAFETHLRQTLERWLDTARARSTIKKANSYAKLYSVRKDNSLMSDHLFGSSLYLPPLFCRDKKTYS